MRSLSISGLKMKWREKMQENEAKAKIRRDWNKQNPRATEKDWELFWESLNFWVEVRGKDE